MKENVVPERPQNAPRFVDVKTAKRYACVGHTKLYELIATDKIEARKMGRTTLIDLDTVDAYLRGLPRAITRPLTKRKRRS